MNLCLGAPSLLAGDLPTRVCTGQAIAYVETGDDRGYPDDEPYDPRNDKYTVWTTAWMCEQCVREWAETARILDIPVHYI